MYCGIGPIPNGKVRGTLEHCYKKNQVRYYGLSKVKDLDLLYNVKANQKRLDEIDTELKRIFYARLGRERKLPKLQYFANNEKKTKEQRKEAQDEIDHLLKEEKEHKTKRINLHEEKKRLTTILNNIDGDGPLTNSELYKMIKVEEGDLSSKLTSLMKKYERRLEDKGDQESIKYLKKLNKIQNQINSLKEERAEMKR